MGAKRKKDPAHDKERLAKLRKWLAATPDGKMLLELAKAEHVPISFANSNDISTKGVFNAAGVFDIHSRTIALGRKVSDETLKGVLPHELRHLWQACVADRDKGLADLSGPDMLVWRRVYEGDAYAYQERFALAPSLKTLNELVDEMAKKGDKAGATREAKKIARDFGMKTLFLDAQADLGGYDKMTLHTQKLELQIAQICVRQLKTLDRFPGKYKELEGTRKECVARLRKLFNRVSAPRKLNNQIVRITRDGLVPRSANYLGFKNAKDLAAFIRRQIPAHTLKRAKAMDKKIKKVVGKALKANGGARRKG